MLRTETLIFVTSNLHVSYITLDNVDLPDRAVPAKHASNIFLCERFYIIIMSSCACVTKFHLFQIHLSMRNAKENLGSLLNKLNEFGANLNEEM